MRIEKFDITTASDDDIRTLLRTYDNLGHPPGSTAADAQQLAWEIVQEIERPIDCFRFLEVALQTPMTNSARALLAAGFLEDFIDRFGDRVIERIESLARESGTFRQMLGWVWYYGADPVAFERIRKVVELYERIDPEPWREPTAEFRERQLALLRELHPEDGR